MTQSWAAGNHPIAPQKESGRLSPGQQVTAPQEESSQLSSG